MLDQKNVFFMTAFAVICMYDGFFSSHWFFSLSKVLFLPFALKDHDGYASLAEERFRSMGFNLTSLHQVPEGSARLDKVKTAEAFFIGGGNSFRLLKALHDGGLIGPIRDRVLEDGAPYIGSSAGTNVSTVSIATTNDMPIAFPPTFDALKLVPFNVNPHYLDPEPDSTHKGETREERILQFLEEAHAGPVLAMREGSLLHVEGNQGTTGLTAILKGSKTARLFRPGQDPKECEPGTDFSFLFSES